ncbi:TIGR00153 family protein [Candidatus Fermentibacteria bacterium]|nr:TIGR00153 family protein [Candidatus Fermentibacteria bacterium]
MKRLIEKLFGVSPFGPLVEHTKKVHECVKLVRPLMEACIRRDHEEIHRLQDQVSRLEYEADQVKHAIREQLPRQYIMPVDRSDLERYLHSIDNVADHAQDFAIVLLIRKTAMHEQLVSGFLEFVDQIIAVSEMLMTAAEELGTLAQASFKGAEAELVLERVGGLGKAEWKADRLQRTLSQHVYELESELDPITIIFYEKMMRSLSGIANSAENSGDILRQMIVKS